MLPCDDRDPMALDRQLCFALYAASRAVTRAYQPMLGELGITYPQYLVLLVLWEAEAGEAVTVGTIGERLMLDSGTLTPLLKRMESAGLVGRRRAVRDERVTEVTLTTAGRALQAPARAWVARGERESPVSRAEIDALRDQLRHLLGKIAPRP